MKRKAALSTREMVLFAMLGCIMYISKLLLEWAPNIHPVGMLVIVYTIVYRKKALIPIFVYVMLVGLYLGFNTWWLPNVYTWALLWGATMLLPRNMPNKIALPVYMGVCGFHGLLYGTLYAPAQALMFGLSFEGMIAWIIAGLPFDALHAAGNLAAGLLIIPLSQLLTKLERGISKK